MQILQIGCKCEVNNRGQSGRERKCATTNLTRLKECSLGAATVKENQKEEKISPSVSWHTPFIKRIWNRRTFSRSLAQASPLLLSRLLLGVLSPKNITESVSIKINSLLKTTPHTHQRSAQTVHIFHFKLGIFYPPPGLQCCKTCCPTAEEEQLEKYLQRRGHQRQSSCQNTQHSAHLRRASRKV